MVSEKTVPYFPIMEGYPINLAINVFNDLKKRFRLTPETDAPWLPFHFIGPMPIWGHFDVNSDDFCGFPKNLLFRIQIDQAGYEKILKRYQMLCLGEDCGEQKLMELHLESEDDYFSYIAESGLWEVHHGVGESDSVIETLKSDQETKHAIYGLKNGFNIVPYSLLKIEDTYKEAIPESLCEEFNAICYYKNEGTCFVLMNDPSFGEFLEDKYNCLFGIRNPIEVVASFCPESTLQEIREGLGQNYRSLGTTGDDEAINIKNNLFVCEDYKTNDESKLIEDPRKTLAYIFTRAIKEGASDIHIEPYEETLRIRFRINTFLTSKLTLSGSFLPRLNSIISQYGGVDTFKKMMPHSGRFTVICRGEPYDIRVSMIPCREEQSCVLRIHGKNTPLHSLSSLGFNFKDKTIFSDAISRKSGIILITGPTGSGKSTTLYAALSELNKEDVSIETIEDPIERPIDGLKQFQVRYTEDENKNLTFPKLFREVLRHDPDVIMVGEIRDLETAKMAINAAQTGHLVLSTLHTQDALGAIPRLISEGVDPQHLADSLILLQAQRLIGTVCTNCRTPLEDNDLSLETLKNEFKVHDIYFDQRKHTLYRRNACEFCQNTGFEGKQAIYELFPITDEIRQRIVERKSVQEIKALGTRVGYRTLYQEALQKVALGKSVYEEAIRYRMEFSHDFERLIAQTKEELHAI